MLTETDQKFMKRAIQLAEEGMDAEIGGPFGAVIVKNGKIIAEGCNRVSSSNDPTAHAEVTAIRNACEKLGTFQLEDCVIYTSCEPCPMCLGAIYWAHLDAIYYACDREDAAHIGFDDQFIYDEIDEKIENRRVKFVNLSREEALSVFKKWDLKENKTRY